MSADKYLLILIQQRMVALILAREYDYLHRAEQILEREKRHRFIVLRIFDGLLRNHSADDDLLVIPQLDLAALLVQQKVRRHRRYNFAPFFLVFLQWMTGQIDADDFLLKAELDLLAVLSDVGILNLIGFFLLLRHQIKQAHLSRQRLLFRLHLLIHQGIVHHHHLLPVAV